jgi:hypothetical protein
VLVFDRSLRLGTEGEFVAARIRVPDGEDTLIPVQPSDRPDADTPGEGEGR